MEKYMPNMEAAAEFGKDYSILPISRKIYADLITPINALRQLKRISTDVFLFESMEHSGQWSRYTFLGLEPSLKLKCSDGCLEVTKGSDIEIIRTREPQNYIQDLLAAHKSPKIEGLPPFTGGLVGYFAYDYMKYVHPYLRLENHNPENLQDIDLMLFKKIIAFDHLKQQIYIIVNIETKSLKETYQKAIGDIERIIAALKEPVTLGEQEKAEMGKIEQLFSKEEFCEKVELVKHHIYEGDIFQLVLSNQIKAAYEGSLFEVYRSLRLINPSPYMFYYQNDEIEIAGASPETLVKLEDKTLYTCPLAGTRPRGKNKAVDQALEAELLEDEKELAEHHMLVDLGRNDLGKISEFGSVTLDKYKEVERFSHVMHLSSTVSSVLKKDKNAMDAIAAILPAGTLSGAPKIRASELINDLEQEKRGLYGGCIGYLDFTGNMDVCIAIRLAYKKNNHVFIRAGAGIVSDSVAANEYEECLHKAKAMLKAVQRGGEGQ